MAGILLRRASSPLQVVSGVGRVAGAREGASATSPGKTHHCPFCPYTTKKKTHMTSHIRVHTKEKPFPCPYCPLRFTQKGNLRTHMTTHLRKSLLLKETEIPAHTGSVL